MSPKKKDIKWKHNYKISKKEKRKKDEIQITLNFVII